MVFSLAFVSFSRDPVFTIVFPLLMLLEMVFSYIYTPVPLLSGYPSIYLFIIYQYLDLLLSEYPSLAPKLWRCARC
jgi:hypothetical protein